MNINTVIEYLNKKYKYSLDGNYYTYIGEWRDWWKGKSKPFHTYTEKDFTGQKYERDLYSLKMGKKVAEDWAAMLLNEKVVFSIDDNAGDSFVNGGENKEDGILFNNDFMVKGNELVEKSFAMGTGAFVLRFENMLVDSNGTVRQSQDTKVRIEYLTADHIIPITVEYGKIRDVAFVSEVLREGKKYVYLERHILKDNAYEITNEYLKEEENQLKEEALPDNMIKSFTTGSDMPLFSIVKPNIVNNISDSVALGISVFANAIDNLKGVDLAYNNFNRDFKLGGKKVFVNEELTKTDENGNTITPDDVAQQLFSVVSDGMHREDGKTLIQEHNPQLRVQENVDGIQAQLDLLSFKCGLGTKYYRFNTGTTLVTATQYVGDRQDLQKNIAKQCLVLESALKTLIKGILFVGKEIVGLPINADAKIEIKFDDSFISDKDSERANDLQEVRDGIMQKYEYRMKWYDESEEEAKSKVANDDPDNWFEE